MDVLCVIGRQLSLQQEQAQNPKLSMNAKSPIKTRLKTNATKIIGKSSAQKNMHPEVADIVKTMLTKVISMTTLLTHSTLLHILLSLPLGPKPITSPLKSF